MFIQVIQGKVEDEAGVRRGLARWREDLMPGAVGYLGTTAGITDDGTFIALARFESADAARANSERPEQGAWFAELEKCFAGEVSFLDCDNVRTWLDGGSDDAGFVQIMQGRSSDVAALQDMVIRHAPEIRAGRPEIIGGLMMDVGDGRYVDAIYFTSEEAAREGEAKEMPPAMQAEFDQAMQMLTEEVRYFDLRKPMLESPPG
jgi:hypothetical protein